MTKEQILGITRHVLTAIGTVIVFKGIVDEATVYTVIGAIMTAASGIWSIIDKTPDNIIKTAIEVQNRRTMN